MSRHVFISYRTLDRDFANRLAKDLRLTGFDVWIDHRSIEGGDPNYDGTIRTGLNDAAVVLYIATPAAAMRPAVVGELDYARTNQIPVVPLWRDGKWDDAVPLYMIPAQRFDVRDEAGYAAARPDLIKRLDDFFPDRKQAFAALPPQNPYKGLLPFERDNAVFFCGRTALTNHLLAALGETIADTDRPRLLPVLGASGSGKSSVVRAGIMPRLENKALGDVRLLPPITPGAKPLDALETVYANALQLGGTTVRADLMREDANGLHLLTERLRTESSQRVVLFIDQFEELFTLTTADNERTQFLDLLIGAASDPNGGLIILLTLRADFFDDMLRYPAAAHVINQNSQVVTALSEDELRDAINEPVALVGARLEPGLTDTIIADVQARNARNSALPLLQFTLERLYDQKLGNTLTREGYKALGGVGGALSKHAEGVYQALPDDDHRKIARSILTQVINPPSAGQEPTRRPVFVEKIAPVPAQAEKFRSVVERLKDSYLLIGDSVNGQDVLELSHETLANAWTTYAEWIKTDQDDLRLGMKIAADADDWDGKPDNPALYAGEELRRAQSWLTRQTLPGNTVSAFIAASAKDEQQRIAEEAAQLQDLKDTKAAADIATAEAKVATERETKAANRARRNRRIATGVGVVAGLIALVAAMLVVQSNAAAAAERVAAQAAGATLVAVGQTATPIAISLSTSVAMLTTIPPTLAYERGVAQNSIGFSYYMSSEFDYAVENYRAANTLVPNHDADWVVSLARSCFRVLDFECALTNYDLVLAGDLPNSVRHFTSVYVDLAVIDRERAEVAATADERAAHYAAAEDYLTRANDSYAAADLDVDILVPHGWHVIARARGGVLLSQERWQEVIDTLEALVNDPAQTISPRQREEMLYSLAFAYQATDFNDRDNERSCLYWRQYSENPISFPFNFEEPERRADAERLMTELDCAKGESS